MYLLCASIFRGERVVNRKWPPNWRYAVPPEMRDAVLRWASRPDLAEPWSSAA